MSYYNSFICNHYIFEYMFSQSRIINYRFCLSEQKYLLAKRPDLQCENSLLNLFQTAF